MSGDFVGRVSMITLVLLTLVTTAGGVLAGWPGALGGLAGGLTSLGSFRWIASGVARAATPGSRGGLAMSALGVGVRHLALFGALALVLVSGAAHPVALLVGLSVLPPVLIAVGLRETRVAG